MSDTPSEGALTPDEQHVAQTIRSYPVQIEFVGGPFDGLLWQPHDRKFSDVWSVARGVSSKSGYPIKVWPVDAEQIVLVRAAWVDHPSGNTMPEEQCLYMQGREGKFAYRGLRK